MAAFFVVGSGTDIGKTYVSVQLLRRLAARSLDVEALKPIISGFSADTASGSDTGVLLCAVGRAVTAESIASASPWRFSAPLSPHIAAELEDRTIIFRDVVDYCKARILQSEGRVTLFEGVGGIMVPITDEHTMLDLVADLLLGVVLVCGTYLGAISHALTALETLRARHMRVHGIVVNESLDGVAYDDTVATVQRFAAPIPVVALRRNGGDTLEALCDSLSNSFRSAAHGS